MDEPTKEVNFHLFDTRTPQQSRYVVLQESFFVAVDSMVGQKIGSHCVAATIRAPQLHSPRAAFHTLRAVFVARLKLDDASACFAR